MNILAMMLTALVLDHWLGEPRRWHPLVGLGNVANRLEQRLNHGTGGHRFLCGIGAWSLLVIPPTLLVAVLQLNLTAAIEFVFGVAILWLCIARKSLQEHTQPIADALIREDLVFARQRTGFIVSRDTTRMDASQMSRAATESILENGNDALIAPLFWFVLAGPAGCVAHRIINTLDAMWGYRTERFEWFGKCSARADDLAAWIPARLTALGYAIAGNTRKALSAWHQDAAKLASPNGGPSMTAGAGALDITLGGPCEYQGKRAEKPFYGGGQPCDAGAILRALRLLDRALLLNLALAAAILLALDVSDLAPWWAGNTP